MAVTKIHRTSRTTLIISIIITIIVLGLFFFGGQVPDYEKIGADMAQPIFTDLLLYWSYALLIITVVALILFAIANFLRGLKEKPKQALNGLIVLLVFAALLVITYVIGDGTLLHIPGYDGTDNTAGMLKLTDMWLYSCYIMLVLTIMAIIVMPLVGKKK